jgi:hypothetical protein
VKVVVKTPMWWTLVGGQSMQEKGAEGMHKEDKDYKNAKGRREELLL